MASRSLNGLGCHRLSQLPASSCQPLIDCRIGRITRKISVEDQAFAICNLQSAISNFTESALDRSALIPALTNLATQLRIDSLTSTSEAGSGHPTSCCSAADVVAALFFAEM